MKEKQLTPEETARIPEWVAKWTAIGLSTTPVDRVECRESISELYRTAGLQPPERFIFCQSPYAAVKVPGVKFSDYIGGRYWAGFLAYESFFSDVCNVKHAEIEKAKLYRRAQVSCGMWWAYAKAAVISEPHNSIHRDDNGLLHCEDAMAISWVDGNGLYAIHGVTVDEQTVLHPETFTMDDFQKQTNIEHRRIMVERYGVDKYLQACDAKPIDMDSRFESSRCLIVDNMGQHWLVGTDGTTNRTYHMAVDPCKTCVEAHNSIFGSDENDICAES